MQPNQSFREDSDMSAEAQDLRSTLAAAPDWDRLNAYERTKRACAELVRRGLAVPSWMALLEIIGKGSSGDINRAKKDFRREHGEALRKLDGFVEGVPQALGPHILGFWSEAIALVRREFDEQVAQWRQRIEQAEAGAKHAEAERDRAHTEAAALQGQVAGLQEAAAALQGHVETERAAREQAERMAEAQLVEVREQRERLEAALRDNQAELKKSLDRFDAERRYSMMQIEEARQSAAREIAAVQERARAQEAGLALEVARAARALDEERQRSQAAAAAREAAEREAAALRQQVQQLQQRVSRAASAARQGVPVSRPARKSSVARLRKNRRVG